MNEVKLVGKVAYVGQLKESAKGKKYLSFSLGTNNAGKMMWHSVMAWDKVAEYIYKILLDEPKKLLFVSGYISYNYKKDKSKDAFIMADVIYPLSLANEQKSLVGLSKGKANDEIHNAKEQVSSVEENPNTEIDNIENEFGF